MKTFTALEIFAAYAHTAEGGQALHLHRIIGDRKKAPRCFVSAVDRGEDIAHLFDQDAKRLAKTARALGVKVLLIERPGQPGQHIDLCGAPLRRALSMAAAETAAATYLFCGRDNVGN